jgi:nucleotide-binding universal stress UspA family protein
VFPQDEFEGYLREMGYDSADPDEVASRHEVVQRAAERFRDSGLEPTVVGRCGDPTEQLTAHIEEHDIDHVFMGGRNRSAVGKAFLGSVSQGVLRGVGVPCTIVMS